MKASLQHTIMSVISAERSTEAVNDFINLCQKIALVQVRRRERSGRLLRGLLGLSPEDIALDCVADLFQRDEAGLLVQLHAYFAGIDIAELAEEELLGHVRRLVFSKVNYGLFRMYNEADPALGKILRNMKLAIQALQHFIDIDRFGESCIAPSLCDTLEHQPPFDRHELERILRPCIQGDESVPSMLAKLSLVLREQEDHCRIVSLLSVAYVFRSVYSQGEMAGWVPADVHEQLAIGDASVTIREMCLRVKSEMEYQYVVRKKVQRQIFDSYFAVVERHVTSRILGEDGDILSLFERLREEVPELTSEQYKEDHKTRLEYVAQLAYNRTIEELRKEI